MADDDERMPPRGRQFRNDTMNDGGKNVGKKYKDADDDDDRNGWKKKKKHRGGKNTSLSLEAFARAGKSTYDKREVLKKRRAEMAAKINKFRKVLKKAGEFVEPTKGLRKEIDENGRPDWEYCVRGEGEDGRVRWKESFTR